MVNSDLINKIYIDNPKQKGLMLSHAGKIWIMPENGVRGAMDMYQPVSRVGKMLKNKVIKKHKTPFFAFKSKIEEVNFDLNEDIKKQLEEALGISDFYVATYMGDSSYTQNDKAVLQVYSDDEIYAYVKVTMNEENAKRLKKEADVLNYLKSNDLDIIPRVIALELNSEVKMLIQSTKRTMGQEVELIFDNKIIDVVQKIKNKTAHNIDYKDSDLYERIEYLKRNLDAFNQDQQLVIKEAIKKVEESSLGEYSLYHGDFTPWNIYYYKGNVNVFDFEYCCKSMPSYMDIFHYITQMSLLGKRDTAQCVMMEYEKHFKLIEKYISNPDMIFICYMIWVIGFYLERSYDNLEKIEDFLKTHVDILEYLVRYRNKGV